MNNKKKFWDKLTRNHLLYLGIAFLLISLLCLFLSIYLFFVEYWVIDEITPVFLLSCFGLVIFLLCSQKFNSLSKDQSEDKRTFGSEVQQRVVEILKNYWEQLIGIGSLLISILCFFFAVNIFFMNIGEEQNLNFLTLLFVFGGIFFYYFIQSFNSLSKEQSEDGTELGSDVKQNAMETMKTFWKNLTPSQFLYLGIAALIASILGAILILKFFWNLDGLQYALMLFIAGFGFFYFCLRKYKSFSAAQSKDKTDEIADKADEIGNKTDEITDSNIDKPYILYLRSSKDDSQTEDLIKSSGMYYTEEEILVGSFKKLGTMLTLDRSGNSTPKLGVKRIYVSDDQWQDKVRELSADARLVIIHLDETDGLNQDWEYCLNTIDDLDKLLFIIPESMTSKEERVDQLVTAIINQQDEIQSKSIDVSQPLNIGSIGLFLCFEKNEDGTYTVKQTQGIGNWDPLKMYGTFLWKSFRNIQPETREFYLAMRIDGDFGDNAFNKIKLSLEPIFKRFNLSPYNEKLAYWVFRIVQVVEYFFVALLIFMTILIICGLLGLLK